MGDSSESWYQGHLANYGLQVDPVYQSEYADDSDDCEVVFASEPAEKYYDGYYCPIYIGEVLNERYIIENKLGWGGFSTVWLAYDKKMKKLVALKVMASKPNLNEEHRMHDEIRRVMRDVSRVVLYEDTFTIKGGMDGSKVFRVLVQPLRGPSLYS